MGKMWLILPSFHPSGGTYPSAQTLIKMRVLLALNRREAWTTERRH